MISKNEIEKQIDFLENADFDVEIKKLQEIQPVIYSYLSGEHLEMLSEDEFKILLFDSLVIIKSFYTIYPQIEQIDAEKLEMIESGNWASFDNSKPVSFRDKLDEFFHDYPQLELLAFVEDSLADDTEMPISSPGKEILFVSLKSLIDLFNDEIQ